MCNSTCIADVAFLPLPFSRSPSMVVAQLGLYQTTSLSWSLSVVGHKSDCKTPEKQYC